MKSGCLANSAGLFVDSGPQLQQAEEHLVALSLELLHRSVPGFFQGTLDERLLHARCEFRRQPEVLPPGRHRTGEVSARVLDSARSAGEVKERFRANPPPTQARPPAHRRIRVGDVDDTLFEEMDDLALE